MFNTIDNAAPSFYDDNQNLLITCEYAASDDYLTIELTGINRVSVYVNITAENLVVPFYGGRNYNSTTPDTVNGSQVCEFGLSPSSADTGYLVDP